MNILSFKIFKMEIKIVLQKFWSFLNTSVGVWLLTVIIGGLFAWQFENYIDKRKRTRELNDKFNRLSLEYEGRLSQYSAWAMNLITYEETDSLVKYFRFATKDKPGGNYYAQEKVEKFKKCVTPNYIRNSIKVLSGKPNYNNKNAFTNPNDYCDIYPTFQAIFDEFNERSTIGLLIEMRLINQELYPISYKKDPDDGAFYVYKNAEANSLNQNIINAVNSFLNPEAVISEAIIDISDYCVSKYRQDIMDTFYKVPKEANFWYSDVFIG